MLEISQDFMGIQSEVKGVLASFLGMRWIDITLSFFHVYHHETLR